LGINEILAVYTVDDKNGLSFGTQLIVPVYCEVLIIVVFGVAPVTGTVMPGIALVVIMAADVAGNVALMTPEFASLVATAPGTVKKSCGTPNRIYPGFAVNVMVAV
jgi:hypothetical protein